MLNKQSIVLFGVEDKSKKAVLTIEVEKDNITGKVRLYNFDSEPKGILSLGITSSDGVIKAGLTKTSNMLYSFGAPIKSFSNNFSCALVNFVGGEPNALLYGSCEEEKDLESILTEVSQQLKLSKNIEEVEEVLDNFDLDYEQQEKKEIENLIDENLTQIDEKLIKNQENIEKSDNFCENSCNCNSCIYKKYFYENNKIEDLNLKTSQMQNLSFDIQEDEKRQEEDDAINDETDNFEQKETENNKSDDLEEKNISDKFEKELVDNLEFYNEIKNQIDILFQENRREEFLERIIENSKWVKVDFGGDSEYYVFGLVYNDDKLKYIGYGVPGVYSMTPKQMSGYPVWLPLNRDDENGFGYWISYQDASTGESVKAIVE